MPSKTSSTFKEYSFNFNRLASMGGISKITKYLKRTNPEESGRGTTYKYHCQECNRVYLFIDASEYRCRFIIDVLAPETLCTNCAILLMQLGVADYGGSND